MTDIFEQLSSPFDPAEVDWRVGPTTKDKTSGQPLCYIDARTVMDRLDTVCGPAGWQNRYVMEGNKTVCEIGIRCGDEWIWKADGAGDSDVEAEKGALSDAFKRAAVRWGVGRYLYDLKAPWVALKAKGSSYVIADDERPRLDALLRGKKAPEQKPEPVNQAADAAKAFARKAIKEVGTTTSIADLDNWGVTWANHIARLGEKFPEEAKAVDAAISAQRAALAKKAAAE